MQHVITYDIELLDIVTAVLALMMLVAMLVARSVNVHFVGHLLATALVLKLVDYLYAKFGAAVVEHTVTCVVAVVIVSYMYDRVLLGKA